MSILSTIQANSLHMKLVCNAEYQQHKDKAPVLKTWHDIPRNNSSSLSLRTECITNNIHENGRVGGYKCPTVKAKIEN